MSDQTWPEWSDNSARCYDLAIACLREQHEARETLTPEEMLRRADERAGA